MRTNADDLRGEIAPLYCRHYDECTTRTALISLARLNGYELSDDGKIRSIGRYGGEDVSVLYFESVASSADVRLDWDDGCADWFELTGDDYEMLPHDLNPLPDWAEVFTDNAGFAYLRLWGKAEAKTEMAIEMGWSGGESDED